MATVHPSYANHTSRTWRQLNGRIEDISDRGYKILALGESGSWLGVGDRARRSSSNFGTIYSGGFQRKSDWMEEDSPGGISQIALGTDGEYFIKGQAMAAWRLSKGMADHVDMEKTWPTLVLCALGRCGSYIVQRSNGTVWSLGNLYGPLCDVLKEKTDKVPVTVRPSPAQSNIGIS